MRRFSLHRRKDRGGLFYAQLWSEDLGRYLSARSTGATTRNEALVVVTRWLQDGWPTGRRGKLRPLREAVTVGALLAQLRAAPLTAEDASRILAVLRDRDLIGTGAVAKGGPEGELFSDFLTRFWCWDGPYATEKRAHGQRIGKTRCRDAALYVRAHWAPYFSGRRLGTISRQDLRDFGLHLRAKGLAPKSCNNYLEAGTVALRWAADNELIPTDPTRGVLRFSGKAKARGVLTPEEAAALFRVPWTDERARVGNLVAMTTGLRAGEVVALQLRDIGQDRIHVRHAWSEVDGLKGTKTGEDRTVPLLPGVRTELLALAASNPHGQGEYLFYAVDPGRPMRVEVLRDGLTRALVRRSLSDADLRDARKVQQCAADWRKRGVCVHSWRHYFAARMADVLNERTVMLATGHKTAAMHERYSAHALEEHLRQAGEAAAKVFSNVVAFPRKAVVS